MSNSSTVTREQAEAVLQAVKAKFFAWCMTYPMVNGRYDLDAEPVPEDDRYLPQLVENWSYGAATFAIVWEEGPSNWAMQHLASADVDEESTAELQEFASGKVLCHKAVPMPESVWVEPIFSYALGIYPAE